jgi:hypothetical protein
MLGISEADGPTKLQFTSENRGLRPRTLRLRLNVESAHYALFTFLDDPGHHLADCSLVGAKGGKAPTSSSRQPAVIVRFAARERLAAALALKPVRVQAQEIGCGVDEPAVRTRPSQLRDVVSRFTGHDSQDIY